MKHRLVAVSLIIGLLFFAAGCAATKSTATWKDPAFNQAKFSNVAVIGVAESEGNRRMFEDEFVKQLQEKNIKAVASYTMFTLEKGKNDKAAVIDLLKQKGVDSVIVTRVMDKTTEQTYYPPTVTYTGPPRAYYGGWYNYYSMGYNSYSTPGYTSTKDIVKLECNVYDFAGEKLVFSGLSDTTITRGSEAKIDSVVKVLLKNILK